MININPKTIERIPFISVTSETMPSKEGGWKHQEKDRPNLKFTTKKHLDKVAVVSKTMPGDSTWRHKPDGNNLEIIPGNIDWVYNPDTALTPNYPSN